MAQLKNDLKEVHIGLEETVCHFQELEDPREPINIHHPLESVIVTIMGLLAGASGPASIADWANVKESLLCGLMPLSYGVPQGQRILRQMEGIGKVALVIILY